MHCARTVILFCGGSEFYKAPAFTAYAVFEAIAALAYFKSALVFFAVRLNVFGHYFY